VIPPFAHPISLRQAQPRKIIYTLIVKLWITLKKTCPIDISI